MRRREALRYAGLLAVGSSLSADATAQSRASTWPVFQFDSGNTGYNPDAAIATDQVGRQWRTSTLGEVVASPVIADGTAFVGSRDGRVYAMDLADGSIRWEYDIGAPIEQTPALHDDRLFVGSTNGKVYALTTDGALDWEFGTDDSEILSAVATDSESLYVLAGEWDDVDGWSGGHIYSISSDRGTEIWRYSLLSSFPHTPAIDSGTLYAFGIGNNDDANGAVIAINTADGTVKWAGGESMGGGITTDGTSVYITSSNTYALDASSGSLRWEYAYPELNDAWIYSSASVEGRSVYVSVTAGDDTGYVYELDAVTGERVSRASLVDGVRSSPVVSDDTVFIGTEGGTVYGLARSDFTESWSFSTGGPVRSTPALVDGSVYVGSNDGYLYSLGRVAETTRKRTATADRTDMPTTSSQTSSTRTTQAPSNPSTEGRTATPTTDFQRGFFTNGGEPALSELTNPFVLTVGGFILSAIGMVYQLLGGDRS